jgi:small subunit ribosomal protein S4
MGRDRGPVGKLSRNLGVNLVESPKIDALMKRRPFASGQHGQARKKISEYAVQLQEKQRLRHRFGVREKQLRRYYEHAANKKGNTGTLLLQQLELRVDNIVFRAGFALTRRQARQIVGHGHVLVNGRRLDISSAALRAGDVLTFHPAATDFIKLLVASRNQEGLECAWLVADKDNLTVRVARLPEREDMDPTTREQLIIEFYSR